MLRSCISHIVITVLSLAGLDLAFEVVDIISGIEAGCSRYLIVQRVVVGGMLTLLRVVVIGHCGQSRPTQAVRCYRHVFRGASWLAPCLRMFQNRRL